MYVFVELVAYSHKAIILRQNLKKKSWSTWNFSVLVGDLIRYNMLYFKTWLSDQSIFLDVAVICSFSLLYSVMLLLLSRFSHVQLCATL